MNVPDSNAAPAPLNLRALGFWITPLEDKEGCLGYPHPAALVDPGWEAERRGRIVKYLREGRSIASYMGFSTCRFEDCRLEGMRSVGSQDFTDGRWLWPEGLAHYVAEHYVRLPDEFVLDAAANDFAVPEIEVKERSASVDMQFWLRWAAENTPPPPAQAGACSLAEAQAVCAELSNARWRASAVEAHGRWRLDQAAEGHESVDFSGPLSAEALRAYLFRHRLPEPQAVLEPQQAIAIADEYARDGRAVRPFASLADPQGNVWWALIQSGDKPPVKPLGEIDFDELLKKIPAPGWVMFTGGWTVNTVRGMDEPAWRFFLEQWCQKLGPPAENIGF